MILFNELVTDLQGLSIQWENKVNELYYVHLVSLERVNTCYIEKMKSRINNSQGAEQVETQLQICRTIESLLKNTKIHEDLRTEPQNNFLVRSSNNDPLKTSSDKLSALTNPYFERLPTEPAPVPDPLSNYRSISQINKEISPPLSANGSTQVMPPKIDNITSPNETSTLVISTESRRFHPWCRLGTTTEET